MYKKLQKCSKRVRPLLSWVLQSTYAHPRRCKKEHTWLQVSLQSSAFAAPVRCVALYMSSCLLSRIAHTQSCASRCSYMLANQLPIGATYSDSSSLPHRKPCFTAPICCTSVQYTICNVNLKWPVKHQWLSTTQLQELFPGYIHQHCLLQFTSSAAQA
jgi:hypothetical protein